MPLVAEVAGTTIQLIVQQLELKRGVVVFARSQIAYRDAFTGLQDVDHLVQRSHIPDTFAGNGLNDVTWSNA